MVYSLFNLGFKKKNVFLISNMQNIYEYSGAAAWLKDLRGSFAAACCYFLYRTSLTKLQWCHLLNSYNSFYF